MTRHRSTRRYCSRRCRQQAYRNRTPSAAAIRKRFDREFERLHADLETHRRQRLLRAAMRGDLDAAAALAKHVPSDKPMPKRKPEDQR